MSPLPNITLREPLSLPVEVVVIDGLPKIIAGHLPVTPLNEALKRRRDSGGATPASLETYTRAARLHAEFAANRGRAIIDVTNEEFRWFTLALTGTPFLDGEGNVQQLSGNRGPRTADLMIALLYTLAGDIQDIYAVRIDWRRYRGASDELIDSPSRNRGQIQGQVIPPGTPCAVHAEAGAAPAG